MARVQIVYVRAATAATQALPSESRRFCGPKGRKSSWLTPPSTQIPRASMLTLLAAASTWAAG